MAEHENAGRDARNGSRENRTPWAPPALRRLDAGATMHAAIPTYSETTCVYDSKKYAGPGPPCS